MVCQEVGVSLAKHIDKITRKLALQVVGRRRMPVDGQEFEKEIPGG
jgi:hypothetical protein